MKIQHLSPSIGSIIYGFEISKELTASLVDELRAIWLDRKVIILRDQVLSSEEYLAFAKKFGTPGVYPFLQNLDGFPEITPVLKKRLRQ